MESAFITNSIYPSPNQIAVTNEMKPQEENKKPFFDPKRMFGN